MKFDDNKIKSLKDTDEISEINQFLDNNILKDCSILSVIFDFLKTFAQKSNFIWLVV